MNKINLPEKNKTSGSEKKMSRPGYKWVFTGLLSFVSGIFLYAWIEVMTSAIYDTDKSSELYVIWMPLVIILSLSAHITSIVAAIKARRLMKVLPILIAIFSLILLFLSVLAYSFS